MVPASITRSVFAIESMDKGSRVLAAWVQPDPYALEIGVWDTVYNQSVTVTQIKLEQISSGAFLRYKISPHFFFGDKIIYNLEFSLNFTNCMVQVQFFLEQDGCAGVQ